MKLIFTKKGTERTEYDTNDLGKSLEDLSRDFVQHMVALKPSEEVKVSNFPDSAAMHNFHGMVRRGVTGNSREGIFHYDIHEGAREYTARRLS